MKTILQKLSLLLFSVALMAVTITDPTNTGQVQDRLFVNIGNNSFLALLTFIISNVILPLVGIVSILYIIIGGFRYITSSGNEEAAEAGKKTLMNAVIGLVIVIFSYIIVIAIINATKGQV